MSPEIQGYFLGSPAGQIREVTITQQSGGKFFLDTQALMAAINNAGSLQPMQALEGGQLIVDNINQRELFNKMRDELTLIRKHLELLTEEKFSPVEV